MRETPWWLNCSPSYIISECMLNFFWSKLAVLTFLFIYLFITQNQVNPHIKWAILWPSSITWSLYIYQNKNKKLVNTCYLKAHRHIIRYSCKHKNSAYLKTSYLKTHRQNSHYIMTRFVESRLVPWIWTSSLTFWTDR